MHSTMITAEDATHWLDVNVPEDYRDTYIETFFNDPHHSMHAFVAMLCIAQCAETPQNYEKVYYAVRDWAKVLDPDLGSVGPVQVRGGIEREAVVARGEMTRQEYTERYL